MMPRDMELIRLLLLRFESDDVSLPAGYSQVVVAYHVEQMRDAGLVRAVISRSHDKGREVPHFFKVQDITPAGHDFLAAIKNEGFWKDLRALVAKRVGHETLDLLVEGAKMLGRNMLNGIPFTQ